VSALLVAAAAAVFTWVWHNRRSRYFEQEVAQRLPMRAEGLVAGAHPVSLGTGGPGALLLHGFGDTPQSLRALAEHLHAVGWTVRVPLLAGHGRSLRALADSRAADWERDARAALDALRAECTQVSIVGQSMGGALAVLLATTSPGASSLVLLAPYFRMKPAPAALGRLHWLATPFVPYVRSRSEGSIRDDAARRLALGGGVTSPRLLHELNTLVRRARRALPGLTTPTLVIHSRHDPRIPVPDAEAAFALLPAAGSELRWVDRSAHVVSVDHDHQVVFTTVADWIDRARLASLDPA
jgi:carboxylesterase